MIKVNRESNEINTPSGFHSKSGLVRWVRRELGLRNLETFEISNGFFIVLATFATLRRTSAVNRCEMFGGFVVSRSFQILCVAYSGDSRNDNSVTS